MIFAKKINRSYHYDKVQEVLNTSKQVILGKEDKLKLALTCLLANGHLLIEDFPGLGKTTLAKVLGSLLGLKLNRIQFTNDLLPMDLLGTNIYNPDVKDFEFHKGPIFSQLILADELNRATPKTQSACLQAMEEGSISLDGKHYQLPKPFFVIATQNPLEQIGTHHLPESQLDRFLMKINMGYPNEESELDLLSQGTKVMDSLNSLKTILSAQDVLEIQDEINQIFVSDHVVKYVRKILEMTRKDQSVIIGLSPRAGLALIKSAKAWAWISGQNMVLPDDVQQVAPFVIPHRITFVNGKNSNDLQWIHSLLESISVD